MVRDARLHARHAAQVVTNMLDFTKLRAGELVLPTDVPFAVQALCEECCTLVSHLVSSKPVALRVDCGELPPGLWLAGAPFHLTQVLVNLLTNAIKSTSKGSVTLAARLYGGRAAPGARGARIHLEYFDWPWRAGFREKKGIGSEVRSGAGRGCARPLAGVPRVTD